MKYFIGILFLLFGGCGVITPDLIQQDITYIASPQEINFIDHGVYDESSNILFITAKQDDGTCGVWSYDNNNFFQLLHIADSTCHGAHIFLIDNVLYVSMNEPARLYRSDDTGQTWHIVLEQVDIFWAMTYSKNNIYGTLWSYDRPAIYRSDDDGFTWYEWKNFHTIFASSSESYDESGLPQMRHLHDIVAYDDSIVVGTGDVMRRALISSEDNNDTWTDVWDEGFTTHIEEDNRIIFGADKITGKGIAVFDKKTQNTRDVWKPQDGWQGYTYSMLKKNSMYYSAFHIENNTTNQNISYGILRSGNGIDWEVWHEYISQDIITQLYILDGPGESLFIIHNGLLSKIIL